MLKESSYKHSAHIKIVPWVVTTSLFMETLDTTILNSAVPVIARSLNESPLNLKVALTSYLISLAILIPISGWLSDKYGTKKILFLGVSLFSTGSILCGISTSLEHLVISRIIQGCGGALMMPVCRLILLRSYPKSELVSVTNYITLPALLGPALGPVIGGVIVTYFSWRWIFFVNIPFCFILLHLIFYHMDSFNEEKIKKFDLRGFILFSIGLAIGVFTLQTFSDNFLTNLQTMCLLVISAIFMILYFHFANKIDHPFIEPRLFKFNTFKISVIGTFFSRIGIGGISFLLPILLQVNHGFSPIQSSTYIIFFAIAMMVAKFFVKPVLEKIGYRNATIINTAMLSVTVACLIFAVDTSNHLVIIACIFLQGFFTSLQFSYTNTLPYVDLPDDLMSKGTSLGSAIQQLSMSFGLALLVFLLRMQSRNNDLVGHNSYNITIFILSGYLLLTSLIFTFLDPKAGENASGHRG